MNALPARPAVAFVLPVYDPSTSGHLAHIYELLRRAARHLDIWAVIERARGDPAGLGVPYSRQRFSFPPLRFAEILFLLLGARLSGQRFFYVHYSFYGALAAWLVTRLCGGTVYYWNSGMPWLYRRPWLTERVFRFVLRHTILVTGTPGLSGEYAARYGLRPERIRIMSNGVNVERFAAGPPREEARRALGIPPDTRVVLFVHRLSRRKGAHLIPEIAAEVTKRLPDVIFVAVGDGPERENVERKAKALGLAPYIRLVGEVPHRDIAPYYRSADAFLMPSEEEGFPHVLLEAMAAGVPYAASSVGGVPEITPPLLQPYVVDAPAPHALAEAVVSLLVLPPAERERIAETERGWVSRYDTALVTGEFQALFA